MFFFIDVRELTQEIIVFLILCEGILELFKRHLNSTQFNICTLIVDNKIKCKMFNVVLNLVITNYYTLHFDDSELIFSVCIDFVRIIKCVLFKYVYYVKMHRNFFVFV